MSEGHFDQHVRRTRNIDATRAHAFEHSALKHWQELMEVPLASAALDVEGHLLRFDEPTTVQKLKSAGIEAVPLGRYAQRHSQGPGLVMGFAPFNEEEIDRAAQRVAAALREAV